jgi:hypothetical protein
LLAVPVILLGIYLYLAVKPPSGEVSLSVIPEMIIQGGPVLIVVDGISTSSEIDSLTINGDEFGTFLHNGKPSALIGIDLRGRNLARTVLARTC